VAQKEHHSRAIGKHVNHPLRRYESKPRAKRWGYRKWRPELALERQRRPKPWKRTVARRKRSTKNDE